MGSKSGVNAGTNLPLRERLCVLFEAVFASLEVEVGAPIFERVVLLLAGADEDMSRYMYPSIKGLAAGLVTTMADGAVGRERLFGAELLLLD